MGNLLPKDEPFGVFPVSNTCLKELGEHFTNFHNINGDGQTFMCYQDGCMRTYMRFTSLRNIISKHPDAYSKVIDKDCVTDLVDKDKDSKQSEGDSSTSCHYNHMF